MGFINFIAELLKDPRTAIAGLDRRRPAHGLRLCVPDHLYRGRAWYSSHSFPAIRCCLPQASLPTTAAFNIVALLATTWAAAILGDQCNFTIGHFFGKRSSPRARLRP